MGNSSAEQTNELTVTPSEALTNCILSQYRFCAGGVGLGAAYAVKNSKGPIPMLAAGVAGTIGDLFYGYYSACRKEVEEYEQSGRK